MKWRVVALLAASTVATIYIVWSIGPSLIFAGVVRAGVGGLGMLCAYALGMFGVLAAAWKCLSPRTCRANLRMFFMARLVRDSISDITPFSPIAGMLAAARLATLGGMEASYAAASIAADATAETMAQVAFLALGFALSVSHFRHLPGAQPLVTGTIIVLLLAIPCIAGLIVLQRESADWVEKIARRLFPKAQEGTTFRQAIHELYGSRSHLAGATVLHLLGWVFAGGGTFFGFRLVGERIGILDALSLEAFLSTLRSLAAFVPAGIGIQEAGYAMLAPMFGLPMEMGVAVSLLKRSREVVIGVPALLYWQIVEGRNALQDEPILPSQN